ncbi:MAG: hypothetical protein JW909_04025 [Planctomycetes bacterium]|nr:hypothetical protein [Planctomycetota bacterium]
MALKRSAGFKIVAIVLVVLGIIGLSSALVLVVFNLLQRETNAFRKAELVASQAGPVSTVASQAYQDFLTSFPDGEFSEDARQRLDRIEATRKETTAFSLTESQAAAAGSDWRSAVTVYRDFLKAFPRGSYAGEAAARVKELEGKAPVLDAAADNVLIDGVEAQLKNKSLDPLAALAAIDDVEKKMLSDAGKTRLAVIRRRIQNDIDEADFIQARRQASTLDSNTAAIAVIQKFLDSHPGTRLQHEAASLIHDYRRCMDDAAFKVAADVADNAGDDLQAARTALEGYLSTYPKGNHADKAHSRLLAIRQRDVEGEARRIIDSGLAISNVSAKDSYDEALRMLSLAKYEKAVEWLNAARAETITLAEKDPLDKVLRFALYSWAVSHRKDGDWQSCLDVATSALRLFPRDPALMELFEQARRENIPPAARALYNKGLELESASSYAEAIDAYSRAGQSANIHYRMLIDKRLDFCRSCLFDDLYGRAKSLYNAGDVSEAASLATEALKLKPGVKYLEQIIEESKSGN